MGCEAFKCVLQTLVCKIAPFLRKLLRNGVDLSDLFVHAPILIAPCIAYFYLTVLHLHISYSALQEVNNNLL